MSMIALTGGLTPVSICPSCGDDANVQKVSGLYREQSASKGITDLARLLAPPQAPRQVEEGLGFAGRFILLATAAVSAFLGLFLVQDIVGLIVGGILGYGLGLL